MGASERAAAVTGLVLAVNAVIQTIGGISIPGTTTAVAPSVGVAFVAGYLLGDRGAFAAAAGVMIGGIIVGITTPIILKALAALTFALVSSRVRGTLGMKTIESGATLSLASAREIVGVTVVATLPAVGLAGSAGTLVIGVPFFITAVDKLVQFITSGVLIGGLLFTVASALPSHLPAASLGGPALRLRPTRVLLISIGWIAVGVIIDLGFTLARIVPTSFYKSRFGLDVSVALFNGLQVGGQCLLVVGVAVAVWRSELFTSSTAGRNKRSDSHRRAAEQSQTSETGTALSSDTTDLSSTHIARRDAILALAGIGLGGVSVAAVSSDDEDSPLTDHERALLHAVTDVVYPSAVVVEESFLETYVIGRYRERWNDRERVKESLAFIDEMAKTQFGEGFDTLSPADREHVLTGIGVNRVAPKPEGRLPERVRYYVINDLLFALYSTPTGGELVGRSNPTGFPGGLEAYQRRPDT